MPYVWQKIAHMSRWIKYNPNPRGSVVGDCTVRAISKAMNQDWDTTYAGLSSYGYALSDMPSANHVWGAYLRRNGFERRLINDHGQDIYTVEDFCMENQDGTYILAIPGHVVCVKDGNYYDSWDSGQEVPQYFWTR